MQYINVTPAGTLPDLSSHGPFKAILTVEEPLGRERQEEVSLWLVRMGCRYVVACGPHCCSWPDAVREANLSVYDLETMSPRDFVMTTSHPHESLRAVFWYAKKAAKHPDLEFQEIVVIHVSNTDRSTEYQAIFQSA